MKLLVLLLVCCVSFPIFAESTFHWGVKAGMNLSQHYAAKDQAEGYIVTTEMRPGICAGTFINFPVTDRLSIQDELFFSQKGSTENIRVENEPVDVSVTYRMDYLEMPILLDMIVIKSGKWRMSSIAGTCLSLKTGSDYSLDGTVLFNNGDSLEVIPITAHSKLGTIDMFDYSFIYGGKLAYQKSKIQWFAEYRFTIGWNSISLPTYMNNGRVSLKNQAYSLLLGIAY